MLDESLAKRYAAALYASASAKKQQREQLKELRIIQKELSEHGQLNQCGFSGCSSSRKEKNYTSCLC